MATYRANYLRAGFTIVSEHGARVITASRCIARERLNRALIRSAETGLTLSSLNGELIPEQLPPPV